MTTIAYRNGIMAADSGNWYGSAVHPWTRKVARGPDGTLYGASGNAAECASFMAWVDGGCLGDRPKAKEVGADDEARSSFSVLVASPDGCLSLVTARGAELYPGAPYMAIGAGAETAFGALYMGATAEQAVEATIMHGNGAVGPVQSVRR